jgi:hypothetical protein
MATKNNRLLLGELRAAVVVVPMVLDCGTKAVHISQFTVRFKGWRVLCYVAMAPIGWISVFLFFLNPFFVRCMVQHFVYILSVTS